MSEIIQILFNYLKDKKLFKKQNIKFRDEMKKFLIVQTEIHNKFQIYYLNEMAYKIFTLCDGRNTVKDIINIIFNKYKYVGKEKIIKDVIIFIRKLERLGVIWVK